MLVCFGFYLMGLFCFLVWFYCEKCLIYSGYYDEKDRDLL